MTVSSLSLFFTPWEEVREGGREGEGGRERKGVRGREGRQRRKGRRG